LVVSVSLTTYTASYQQKRDILDLLAIKVIASNEGAEIEGIIPLEKIPTDINSASTEPTLHYTNIGITLPRCVGLPFRVKA
jgi:hypothetical protein